MATDTAKVTNACLRQFIPEIYGTCVVHGPKYLEFTRMLLLSCSQDITVVYAESYTHANRVARENRPLVVIALEGVYPSHRSHTFSFWVDDENRDERGGMLVSMSGPGYGTSKVLFIDLFHHIGTGSVPETYVVKQIGIDGLRKHELEGRLLSDGEVVWRGR